MENEVNNRFDIKVGVESDVSSSVLNESEVIFGAIESVSEASEMVMAQSHDSRHDNEAYGQEGTGCIVRADSSTVHSPQNGQPIMTKITEQDEEDEYMSNGMNKSPLKIRSSVSNYKNNHVGTEIEDNLDNILISNPHV